MAGATATQDQDLDEMEEEFAKNFSNYLIFLSNVSADFDSGGQTTATLDPYRTASKAVPSAVGALVPFGRAAVRPLEEAIQKMYNKMDREDRKKIYKVLPQKKKDARKIFVDAAVKIFRMFEYQFSNVIAEGDEDGRRAMAKLAEDAAERVINYVIEECDEIIKTEFHKSRDFVFNGVLFGDSKRKIIRKGRTVLFKGCDSRKQKKINTTDLFETSGYILNENGSIVHKELQKGSGAEIYGYKKLWPFDEFYNTKETNGKWVTVENSSFQYEYQLPFSEEEVTRRGQEIVKKIERKENSTKGDVINLGEMMEKAVEEFQKGNKSMEDLIKEAKRGKTSFTFTKGENIRKLNQKWWPDKKLLIKSLLERKSGGKLLNEVLKDRLSKDENRMVVICESLAASKYSGMGGVGKTLTAKWYAHIYEQEYDHIIWIDCGEGSLLTSFESLARDLEIPNRNELVKVQDYSRKCFRALSGFKCLWIYDNAENYKEKDGIINVLPKDEKNFYCIITSRSREWGTEKIGFGKISYLELDIFSEKESLNFFKLNLDGSLIYTDLQLKELCRLMGNLPLAVQLAAAALNNGKIELQNYIENTSSKDLGTIFEERFDDYEKTINQCIRISLDLILKQKNGKLAYDILIIFGYIRPDDVRSMFIMKVLNTDRKETEEAINLLEKYSLITKSGIITEFPYDDRFLNRLLRKHEIKIDMDLLSIHRLLQQIIRHNGRKTENETLQKILGCSGFIDYKFIPFTKFANEKLQKAFPKVRAELLDQRQLKKLINEKRFEESVQLAKFINEEMKIKTTKFNFAVCLSKNEQLEESLNILKELEKEEIMETRDYFGEAVEMGMLGLKEECSRDLISGHLLIIYWKLGDRSNLKELLKNRQRFEVIYCSDSLGILVRLFHSDLIKLNYSLVKHYSPSIITLELEEESNRIELWHCLLDLSSFDRLSAEELKLCYVSFNMNGREIEEANINKICDLDKINKLTLSGWWKAKMSIELSEERSMEYLSLFRVEVLNWKDANWVIQKLDLDIPFVKKTKMKIKEIEFQHSSLDISFLPPTIEKLDLYKVEVVCNGPLDLPNLKYLTLYDMTDSSVLFSFRSVNLTHIHFHHIKEINVDQLPETVTLVKITNRETIVVGGVKRVDKLILEGFSSKRIKKLLSHIQNEELVVCFLNGFTPKELIDLMKKEIKRIAVGRINLYKEDFSVLSSYVDRKADYYLWEGGRGRGIMWKDFEELVKLY